jgi:hypothetical protein
MIEGWICPKCGSVYAPWVAECDKCNKNRTERTSYEYKTRRSTGLDLDPLRQCVDCQYAEFIPSDENGNTSIIQCGPFDALRMIGDTCLYRMEEEET